MPRLLLRLLAVLAVVTLVTAVLLPVPTVLVNRRLVAGLANVGATPRQLFDPAGRLVMADFLPATDTTVGMEEAGSLLRQLLPLGTVSRQLPPYIKPPAALPLLWEGAALDTSLFTDARGGNLGRGLFDRRRVFVSVQRGLTPEERAYAANVAGDSVWRAFDRVSRAGAADLAAATFTMPIPPTLPVFELPISRTSRVSALSDGVAMRAAVWMAAGQRDSAEAMLSALYGVGVLLHRDGLNLIDGLLGYRMAMNAAEMRRALHDAFPVAGSPTVIALVDSLLQAQRRRSTAVTANTPAPPAADFGRARAELVALATSPTERRPRRFEALGLLGITNCGSLRSLLFGSPPEVAAAQAAALRDLPRSPAERAYVTLLAEHGERTEMGMLRDGAAVRAFRSANAVLATVLFTPRLRACSDLVVASIAP